MINTPYKQLENSDNTMHPGLQFLIFILLSLGIIIIGSLIGAGVTMLLYGVDTVTNIGRSVFTDPNAKSALWLIQVIGTTIPILLSPLFFAYVIMRNPAAYLKTNFRFSIGLLLIILLIMFVSNPVIEFLSNLNQKMVLPHWLKWMRESEDNAEKITEAMLQMKTLGDMIINVLAIGLVTAIVEEFMFRGVMQTIFTRWTKNTHAAIWITATLFSAFHMEFFGFLPRLLLGVLFGYFVAWSGSVWTSVWAHFLNNGTAVAATYFFEQKVTKVNPDDQHLFNPFIYITAFLIMLALLFIYKKLAQKPTIAAG